MNRNFIEFWRCMTGCLSVVLPVLVKDLFEAIRVNGADLATVRITMLLHVLNRFVNILIITGLNGSDHVFLLVEDSRGDGEAGNTRPRDPIDFRCVTTLLVLCAVAS